MITYRLYIRKPESVGYIKRIHIKYIDGKFYSSKPGRKYKLEPSYKSWNMIDAFLLPNFYIDRFKSDKLNKALTEVQWLDKVCENFKD